MAASRKDTNNKPIPVDDVDFVLGTLADSFCVVLNPPGPPQDPQLV